MKTKIKTQKPKTEKKILSLEDSIKKYLKDNLSISVSEETSDFMTTDCSRKTRITVSISLDGEEISSDSYSL